jgi:acyl-CoA synthetase (AMP-forming)/AMP-acid ligase II
MRNVAEAFRASVATWGDHPFLTILPAVAAAYGEAAATWSYAEAACEVEALAERYRNAGYGRGHRIGLMLGNRSAFFFHWLALNACGASVVPLSAELRPAELDYQIAHSGIVLAVVAAAHHASMVETAFRAPQDLEVVLPDGQPTPASPGHGDAEECAVLYTSGTTAKPKGCVLNNDYFVRAGEWYIRTGGLCEITPGHERLITPLPMTHMNAMAYSTMAMLMSGGCIVPLDRFHPRSWWSSVRDSKATIVHYLGVMPSMLLAAEPESGDRQHDVRFGFGAGVDRRHHERFETRFGFPLLEAWAMTETGAGAVVIANRLPRRVGDAVFGKPETDVDVRIIDEQGDDLANDEPGELLVRAAGANPRAGFFSHYLHDPEATELAWQGGWFHTGDVVRREADGNLVFVDRRKNIIRRSGENISAVEVETALRLSPLVADVAVTAVADDIRGEEVLAFVVPREPVAHDAITSVATAIVNGALNELSYFKVPGWIVFVDALPLTATQKVQRGALKGWVLEWLGRPDCVDTRKLKSRVGQPV